jgi:hypothetical protein
MKLMQDIFVRELERLDKDSREGPLEIEDVRKLECLARAWRSYCAAKIEKEADDLSEYTTDELLAIARGETQGEAEPEQDRQDT